MENDNDANRLFAQLIGFRLNARDARARDVRDARDARMRVRLVMLVMLVRLVMPHLQLIESVCSEMT